MDLRYKHLFRGQTYAFTAALRTENSDIVLTCKMMDITHKVLSNAAEAKIDRQTKASADLTRMERLVEDERKMA